MKYFEDSILDKKLVYPGAYELTEENIIRMGEEWDPQPFHVDKEAAKESYFGGLVACTTHLFGISSKLCSSGTTQWATVSALGTTDVKNRAPARPGDVLTLHATCISKRESKSKPELGIVEYHTALINQNDEVVFSYVSSALHKKRPRNG
jgi:acyl dehydratase